MSCDCYELLPFSLYINGRFQKKEKLVMLGKKCHSIMFDSNCCINPFFIWSKFRGNFNSQIKMGNKRNRKCGKSHGAIIMLFHTIFSFFPHSARVLRALIFIVLLTNFNATIVPNITSPPLPIDIVSISQMSKSYKNKQLYLFA